MSTATDIKEALIDVGVAISINKNDGRLITGEYIDVDVNAQITKWFVRGFFLECAFPYDTQAVVGDVIYYSDTGLKYLVMNLDPVFLENSSIERGGVLYRANVSGELLRATDVRNPVTYKMETVWSQVASGCHALLVERLFGQDLDTHQKLGDVTLAAQDLYIPNYYKIQVNDRYRARSGEYYRVEQIKTRNFDAIDVVVVGEDTR